MVHLSLPTKVLGTKGNPGLLHAELRTLEPLEIRPRGPASSLSRRSPSAPPSSLSGTGEPPGSTATRSRGPRERDAPPPSPPYGDRAGREVSLTGQGRALELYLEDRPVPP